MGRQFSQQVEPSEHDEKEKLSQEAQAVLDRAELSSLLPRKRLSLENNLGQDDEQDE
jgi:hypothetical protein